MSKNNEQLLLGLEKNKIEPTKEKAKDKLNVDDEIRIIKLRPESKKALSCYGRKLDHRKGKVINILGTERDPFQGIEVKFGKKGFEYAFYSDEVKKVKKKKKKEAKLMF